MRITGGIPVGGNLQYAGFPGPSQLSTDVIRANIPGASVGAANPLLDPRFKIQGGEPWNKTPLLPGKDTKEFEERQFGIPMQPQLPAAGIGNVGGLIAQQPQNNTQDVSGFERLLEGLEEQQRLRMRGADQMQVGPNQFMTYPTQQRPF